MASCGQETEPTTLAELRDAALLLYPKNLVDCPSNTSMDLSMHTDSTTQMEFKWEAVDYADAYQFTLNNQITGAIVETTVSSTSFATMVDKLTEYTWTVKSISYNENVEVVSAPTSFYIQSGIQINNPPHQAKAISPKNGRYIASNSLELSWTATDNDHDIMGYELYLDTNFPPTSKVLSTNYTKAQVSLTEDKVYFWKVKTIDKEGYTSHSEVFQFRKVSP
jgi:hypothetical protein